MRFYVCAMNNRQTLRSDTVIQTVISIRNTLFFLQAFRSGFTFAAVSDLQYDLPDSSYTL